MKIMSEDRDGIEFRKRLVAAAGLFVPEHVISAMADQADDGLAEDKEILGLIIGRFYRDDNGTYAIAERIATSGLDADRSTVRFDKDSLEDLFDELDLEKGQCVIGWYHSHLDAGCFMSPTDISTQKGIFGDECGFAIVIDPVRKELDVFDSDPEGPKHVDMVIMDSD